MYSKQFIFMLVIFTISLQIGCKKNEETTATEGVQDELSNVIDSTISSANSQANAIVYSGMLTFNESDETSFSDASNLTYESKENLNTLGVIPQSTCSISSARSSCSSSTITVNWNSCTVSNSTFSATVTGVITETYSGFGAALCMLNDNGAEVARKVDDSNPRTITFTEPTSISGAKIVSKMNPDTAYDGTTFPSASTGTTITRLQSGTSNGLSCSTGSNACYHIVANGTQNTMTGPKGTKWFDHILTSDLTAQGLRSSGTLAMSGTSTVWHQVAQYKAVNTFNSVTWGNSSCCFPTSGTITSTITGSTSGTATTAFSSTCGTATFTNTDGSSSTITLKQCQP